MKSLNWKIGDVNITQLVELEEYKIFSSFIPKAKPDIVKKIEWLSPHFIDENGNLLGLIQTFLVQSEGKNILIDTCNGNEKNRPNVPEWANLQTDYLSRLEAMGVTVDSIDIVICTHMHFDHIGWNTRLSNGTWVPTFPNAQYLFSKGEYEYWSSKPEKEWEDDLIGIDDSVKPIIDAGLADLVPDNYMVDKCIRFLPTPGHTPHHVSIEIESNGEKAIISGDALHHPCQIAYQKWGTTADTYPEKTVGTRKKLLSKIVGTDTLLIGTHFNYPVAGKVVNVNGEIMFEVEGN